MYHIFVYMHIKNKQKKQKQVINIVELKKKRNSRTGFSSSVLDTKYSVKTIQSQNIIVVIAQLFVFNVYLDHDIKYSIGYDYWAAVLNNHEVMKQQG